MVVVADAIAATTGSGSARVPGVTAGTETALGMTGEEVMTAIAMIAIATLAAGISEGPPPGTAPAPATGIVIATGPATTTRPGATAIAWIGIGIAMARIGIAVAASAASKQQPHGDPTSETDMMRRTDMIPTTGEIGPIGPEGGKIGIGTTAEEEGAEDATIEAAVTAGAASGTGAIAGTTSTRRIAEMGAETETITETETTETTVIAGMTKRTTIGVVTGAARLTIGDGTTVTATMTGASVMAAATIAISGAPSRPPPATTTSSTPPSQQHPHKSHLPRHPQGASSTSSRRSLSQQKPRPPTRTGAHSPRRVQRRRQRRPQLPWPPAEAEVCLISASTSPGEHRQRTLLLHRLQLRLQPQPQQPWRLHQPLSAWIPLQV